MRQPWRLSERGARFLDNGLAGFLVATVFLGTSLGGFSPLVGVLCIAMFVPLFWRRSHSVLVAVAIALSCFAQLVLTDLPIWGQVAVPIAIYSVARFSTARWGYAILGLGLAGAALGPVDWFRGARIENPAIITYFFAVGAIVAAAWALGAMGRTRAAYVASLVERSERLERESAQQAQLAAQDERARIAREMHDVVAHGLSVIVVQADGARYAAAKDPRLATEALETISETGRESLTEMRRMLGLLRADGGVAMTPQPGLPDLLHLVEEARAGGMDLAAELPDPMPDLSAGVALTAYRIAQESLTNVRKHAGAAKVRLSLECDAREVVLHVIDDGRGAAARSDEKGLGLVGMHERVAVHGGRLIAGPAAGGGFSVSARIPT